MPFPSDHLITTLNRKLIAIEQAGRLGDKSSVLFQIGQLQQIGQQVQNRSDALQKQLDTGEFDTEVTNK